MTNRKPLLIFIIAAAIALTFALYTNQRWEDYYITFRSSKNLAAGNGLVFQVGEKLHTFTSPLGVLLPALASWCVGPRADDVAFWIFRIISIAAFAGAAATTWKITQLWNWSWPSQVLAVGLVMTDVKSVSFSINGMETGLVLLFLALATHALVAPSRRSVWWLGGSWSALMWTRPDSWVFFGATALACWLFPGAQRIAPDRKSLAKVYLGAAGICALLYAPWLIWSWSYYGSPIPHTVVAKSLHHPLPSVATLAEALLTQPFLAFRNLHMESIIMPTYAFPFGGWPAMASHVARGLMCLVALGFLLPRVRPEVRAASLASNVALLYLFNVDLYPWYIPPGAFFAFLTIAGLAESLLRLIRRPVVTAIPAAAIMGFSIYLLIAGAVQLKWQQRTIEGQRRSIGEWLKANRDSASDTVFLEPVGYIGYYSQLKMLDYPGLTSEEVVEARRELGENRLEIIAALKPRWVVQRPGEIPSASWERKEWFREHYTPVKIFDVSEELRAIHFLPGRPFLEFDQRFLIWRRNS